MDKFSDLISMLKAKLGGDPPLIVLKASIDLKSQHGSFMSLMHSMKNENLIINAGLPCRFPGDEEAEIAEWVGVPSLGTVYYVCPTRGRIMVTGPECNI